MCQCHKNQNASLQSNASGKVSQVPDQKTFYYAVLTLMASLIGIVSDLILGYAKPGSIGAGGIIQVGWADYALWRPGVSMFLASVAFPFYLLGTLVLYEKVHFKLPKTARVLRASGFASACGWLLTHVFFCCPQYVFAYHSQKGAPTEAAQLAEELLWMLFPSLLIYMLFMATTLVLFACAILTRKTEYPRFVAFLSPIPVAVILSILRLIFPKSALILGLTTASVHIGMFCLFAYIATKSKLKMRK